MTVQEAVEKIENDNKGFQTDEGSLWGATLADALYAKGWKKDKMYSTCKVASFETRLKNPKTEKVVSITSSYFGGHFTIVDRY